MNIVTWVKVNFMSSAERICPICKIKFKPTTKRQKFCSVICYRIHYKTASKTTKFPIFICSQCGHKEMLNFMPNRKRIEWENYKCPKCDYRPCISEDLVETLAGRAI